MVQICIYAGIAFLAGFLIAWVIRSITLAKMTKLQKSTAGYLESEKLMKETLQKEIAAVHQMKQVIELDYAKRLKDSQDLNRMLDESILLLQKSNEETEALMKQGQPALHDLKLKLIEANNTIARIKANSESAVGK